MEQITIRVHNRDKAELLLALLRSLDFVDSVETEENTKELEGLPEGKFRVENRQDQFMALAGLWAGLPITQDSLRQQAWPRQNNDPLRH